MNIPAGGKLLAIDPAKEKQYEQFLQIMQAHMADYIERTMELMQMTWDEFAHLFRTVGQICGIYKDGQMAGFYWIEEREKVLHLHALILLESFRGQGIGSQILAMLEADYRDRLEVMELGVHESNIRAKALYERSGFETVKTLSDLGFYVMQKRFPL